MEIHIARDGVQLGPFPPEEVRRQLSNGTLLPGDLGWSEGLTAWVPLATFPGLTPPPVPGAAPGPAAPPLPQHVSSGNTVARYRVAATSAAAIASMVMGILSWTLLPIVGAVVAIICGHVARSDIRRSRGEVEGDGMAISGLIMGYFHLGLIAALLLLVVVPLIVFAGLSGPRTIFDRLITTTDTPSLTNANQVAIACRQYARDHDEKFPPSLEALVPTYLPKRDSLTYPHTEYGAAVAYTYFGESGKVSPGDILFKSKSTDAKGKWIVAHGDGSVSLEVTDKPFLRSLPAHTPRAATPSPE